MSTEIDTAPLLAALSGYDVPVTVPHTGGGNYVIGVGECHGYSEEHGTDLYDVMVGPVYRHPASFVGYSGDLYLVSASPSREDVIVHIEGQLLPTVLSMLGIEDVNVSDPCVSLDDISTELGTDDWPVVGLGGNTVGLVNDAGVMVTLGDGQPILFAPADVTIGRQSADDFEWVELWSGTAWTAEQVADIVRDRA